MSNCCDKCGDFGFLDSGCKRTDCPCHSTAPTSFVGFQYRADPNKKPDLDFTAPTGDGWEIKRFRELCDEPTSTNVEASMLMVVEEATSRTRQELLRCGQDMGDGSICGVKLNCHLHDWRQKDFLQETIDSILNELPKTDVRILTAEGPMDDETRAKKMIEIIRDGYSKEIRAILLKHRAGEMK